MKLAVISPEGEEPRETAVLAELLAAGLERYHLRKPGWSREKLETWLRALPAEMRSRLVLHQHHELVAELGLGGRHWRDDSSAPAAPPAGEGFTSRSCHDFAALRAALGHYDSVFFGPVFPSVSKPGYATELTLQVERDLRARPMVQGKLNASGGRVPSGELSALLNLRTPAERRTAVLALGGITAENISHCHEFGFDGVAVIGAVWQAANPVRAFLELQSAAVNPAGSARLHPSHAA